MSFHDRLKKLILAEGKISVFEQKLGFSFRSLSGAIEAKRGIGSDRLELIFAAYPNWNPTWLFTGKGDMYLDTITSDTKYSLINSIEPRLKEIEKRLGIPDPFEVGG
jgi:hypothetical protein